MTNTPRPLSPSQLSYIRAILANNWGLKLDVVALREELAFYLDELGIEVHGATRGSALQPLAELYL